MGEALAANQPGLPGRLFSFVLVDVPRKHETYDEETGSEKAPENHYPVMEFHELVDFPIDSFAAPDSIIAHWSTAASLIDDLEILAQWGFVSFRVRDEHGRLARGQDGRPLPPQGGGKYGSHQIWHKRRAGNQTGMGRWFRDMHEVLILARRGNLDLVPAPLPGTQAESVFVADWAGHSVKPGEQIREWINRCWPLLSKVEIFARGEAPPGWVFWGNQAVRSPEAGPAAVSTSEFVCGIAYEKPAEKDVRTSKGHDSLEIPAFLRRKAEEQIPPAGAPA
jgi:N6-adenosine-specific RNA methylase IME4